MTTTRLHPLKTSSTAPSGIFFPFPFCDAPAAPLTSPAFSTAFPNSAFVALSPNRNPFFHAEGGSTSHALGSPAPHSSILLCRSRSTARLRASSLPPFRLLSSEANSHFPNFPTTPVGDPPFGPW